MQPNRRLIQHIQRAHQPRSQRSRQLNPLRLAARQRRRKPVQRQIFQPHIVQKSQPLANLLQQFVRNFALLRTQLNLLEKSQRVLDRKRANLADVFPVDLDLPRLQPQPRPVAIRTQRISAIAAEKHAHVQLVFLALQVIEKSAHPQKLSLAVEHQILVLVLQVSPRHIQRNPRLLGIALQIGKQRTILGLGPGLNRTVSERLHLVRNHQIEIEVDRIPKSLAPRASPIRIVERKQPRLRLLIPQVAVLALKPLRKPQCLACVGGAGVERALLPATASCSSSLGISKITSPDSR